MNRIDKKFIELKENNKKALITFITSGDPDLQATKLLVKEMEKNGADIIELGIPYSDPVAEGPVIQKANLRALNNGIKIKDIMDIVRDMRKDISVPIIYLLYFNCILQYGPEKFFSDCAASGVDGVIVPDLPFEEQGEIADAADKYGIYIISLVSPTSKERIAKIADNAKGFIYCVSSLGVTGARNGFDTDFNEFFSYIDRVSGVPKAIGFGISSTEHVSQLKGYCDGLIVGSALVRLVETSTCINEAVCAVGAFVKELRNAIDR